MELVVGEDHGVEIGGRLLAAANARRACSIILIWERSRLQGAVNDLVIHIVSRRY